MKTTNGWFRMVGEYVAACLTLVFLWEDSRFVVRVLGMRPAFI